MSSGPHADRPTDLPSVSVDAVARAVTLRFSGIVTFETLQLGREAIQREPGWSRRFAHVFDLRDVVDVALTTAEIRALASAPPVFDPAAPQILVVRRGSFEYTLAATFSALAEGSRNVHVVSSMDAAQQILAASTW